MTRSECVKIARSLNHQMVDYLRRGQRHWAQDAKAKRKSWMAIAAKSLNE